MIDVDLTLTLRSVLEVITMDAFETRATSLSGYTPVLKLARGQSVEVTVFAPSIDVATHWVDRNYICGDQLRCSLCTRGVGSRLSRYTIVLVDGRRHLLHTAPAVDAKPFDPYDVLSVSRNRTTNHVKVQRLLVAGDGMCTGDVRDTYKAVCRLHKLPIIEEMWERSDEHLADSIRQMALKAASLCKVA
jgi:hypothetical protein